MRITSSMLSKSFLWDVNKNLERMEKAQKEITSKKQIQVASDDPVKAARILKMRSYVSEAEQLNKNADDASSWLEFCDTALGSMGNTITDIDELITQASNGTYSEEDLLSIKAEITELKKGLLDLGNSSYNGRYVFAGFDTDSAPLETTSTAIGDMTTYRGKYLSLGGVISASVSDADIESFVLANAGNRISNSTESDEILYKVGAANKVCINAEGHEIFGKDGSSLFDTLAKLEMALSGETSYKKAVYSEGPPEAVTVENCSLDISSLLTDIGEDFSRVLSTRTKLGAKSSYIELVQNRLSGNTVTFTELLSKNQDADYTESSIKLSTAETVYDASLAVGSRIIVKSLLDFLG